MTSAKLNDGVRCVDTSHKLGRTAAKETSTADESKGKHYFTGAMTHVQSKYLYNQTLYEQM